MKLVRVECMEPWFSLLKSGEKTYEGRVRKRFWNKFWFTILFSHVSGFTFGLINTIWKLRTSTANWGTIILVETIWIIISQNPLENIKIRQNQVKNQEDAEIMQSNEVEKVRKINCKFCGGEIVDDIAAFCPLCGTMLWLRRKIK